LWVVTVQFAFFNLITWAPWMLLGPVEGRSYLGGAAVWGAIMAVQGAGAIAAGLLSLGRRPGRPMVIATVGTFCYALPDIPMALHATAPWVAAAAFACGAGASVSNTFFGTALQQQVPPDMLARVTSLSLFPAYGVGVIGYAVDGPLASAFGAPAVFGVGAAYGLLSSAAVLALPSVRALRWRDRDHEDGARRERDHEAGAGRDRDREAGAGRDPSAPTSPASGLSRGSAEGGEGGQPRDHGDHDRDREHLRHVSGGREGDDAERDGDSAHGHG
jgi:Transmembrane secretion effector